jgi:hypothetical protein
MGERARITHYDFSNLLYSSFYLSGFGENTAAFDYEFGVSKSVPAALGDPVPEVERSYMLLFEAALPSGRFAFCIDTRDQGHSTESAYDVPLLDRVAYYFKVNYNREAIDTDPQLRPFASKIVPVLPFFPVRPAGALRYAPRLTPCRNAGWTFMDALRRVKHLRDTMPLEDVRLLRDTQTDLDLFFLVVVTGKQAHRADDAYRHRLAREIQRQRGIIAKVGLVSRGQVPREFSDLLVGPYALKGYLAQLARAKVAVYLRGLHDCLSFKLGQLLALGRPIVGQRILNNRGHIMSHARFDEQFAFEEPEAIVARATELLAEPAKRAELAEANRRTFDAAFTPKAVVAEVLNHIGVPARA